MATEFVGIELELRGEEGVYNDLRKIQSIMNSLGGRKKIDAGLQDARRQVVAYRGELEKLQREQKELKSAAKEAGDAFVQAQNKMSDALANVNNRYKGSMSDRRKAVYDAKKQVEASKQVYDDATQAVTRHQEAIEATTLAKKDAEQAERVFRQGIKESGKTFQQTATAIASRARQVGGSMQSLGNAMTRMTSPFTRLASGFVMGAGYKALNTMTEGLSRGFERYDTMKKYPKIMNAFGYSAEEARKSIDALDQSVRGLPTGLDEMVDMSQRFTATTGNIEKGTKLAIAANNAFLASMSTDTQRYQGMMQLQDVLGGKDMNAREWNSLVSSMTPAIVKMGESLGYTSSNMDEWIQKVRDGKVANEDFIDTLIKVGTEGGEVAKMAENSKDTWQAFFANVGNAASRMTAGVIKAFDELTQQLYGKDLNKFMSENVITAIDNMAKSVQNWVKANPDKIIDFFNALKSIDFAGFGKGLIEGYGAIAKIVQNLSEAFGDKSLKWLGKAMIFGNIAGRLMSIFGGVVRGLAPTIGKVGALLARVGKIGLFGKIAELFGGIGGKMFGAKEAKDVAEGASALGKASGSLVSLAKNVGLITATIAGVSVGGFVTIRSFKTMLKDLREMAQEVNSMTAEEWGNVAQVLAGMGVAITAFVGTASIIGNAVESLSGIATAPTVIGGAVMALVGLFGDIVIAEVMASFKMFEQSTKFLKQGLKNIEELGNIKVDKDKIGTALGAMKQIMETFDASYDEGGSAKEGGVTHSDWSARSKNFKTITKNISEAVTSIKDTMTELDTLPDITDTEAQQATDKVTNIVEKMRDIAGALNMKFDTGLLDFLGGGTVITKGTTARAGSIVENIGKSITNIKNTVDDLKSFENIKFDVDKATGNVKNIGAKMGEIFTALNEAFGNQVYTEQDIEGVGTIKGSYNEGVTEAQTDKAEALKTLFDSYKQTTSAIRSVYEDLVGGKDKEAFNPTKFKNMMKGLVGEDGKGGILSEMKGLYDNLISESEGFGKDTDVDIAGKMEGFSKAVTAIRGIYETLLGKEGDMKLDSGEMKKMMGNITGGSGILAQLKGMYDELIDEEKGFGKAGNANYGATLEGLSKAMTSIRGIYESIMGGEGQKTFDLNEFNSAMKAITGGKKGNGILSQLASVYRDLIDEEKGFGKESDVDLSSIMTSFDTAMTSISNVVNTLKGMSEIEGIDGILETTTGKDGIMSKMQELYSSLISEEGGFGAGADVDLAGLADGFAQAMTSVKNAITTLQEIEGIEFSGDGGMGGVVDSINQMVADLTKAFNEDMINTFSEQVEAFKAQIETIKTTIQSLGEGGIEVNIEIIPNITGDDTTVNELNDAHDAIKTARDAIKKLSESINLSFPISVSLPGLESAIAEIYSAASRLRAARASLSAAGYATGGTIAPSAVKYYAGGGNVRGGSFPGRPRGTDTVPIWATPGEFMMRKRAVDLFGTEFMRRVNNLDVKGAMNALMAKAGSMANVGRQTVINNTYNNNQKVVQNINTNSPDFAYRSASRFVGAF